MSLRTGEAIKLWQSTTGNRATLSSVRMVGCFQCKLVYRRKRITHYTDDDSALCPYCDTQSVLPRPTPELLVTMNRHWFTDYTPPRRLIPPARPDRPEPAQQQLPTVFKRTPSGKTALR